MVGLRVASCIEVDAYGYASRAPAGGLPTLARGMSTSTVPGLPGTIRPLSGWVEPFPPPTFPSSKVCRPRRSMLAWANQVAPALVQ